MSQYREADVAFPWLPILLLFSSGILFILMGKWAFSYLQHMWYNHRPIHHHKKKRKHKKKAKYSDSDSSSSDDE